MPSAEGHIPTDRAARYLEQLCGHLSAMGQMRHLPARGHGGSGAPRVEQVEQTPDRAMIRFADGSWVLEVTGGALTVRIEAIDPPALERLKSGLDRRVAKIGRRDGLAVAWSPA